MKKLLQAVLVTIGLFVFSPAVAQTTLQEYNGRMISDPEIRPDVCAYTGIISEQNGSYTCLMPEDRRSICSASRTTNSVRAYPAPTTMPNNLPLRLFQCVSAVRGAVSGEQRYVELVMQHGPAWRLAYANAIEAHAQMCQSLQEPERPRESRRVDSRSGFSYSGRSGGLSVRHRYDNRYQARPETEAEAIYALRMARYAEAHGFCEQFMAGYNQSNNWYRPRN